MRKPTHLRISDNRPAWIVRYTPERVFYWRDSPGTDVMVMSSEAFVRTYRGVMS
jgi:hypothetical protein